LVRNSDGGRGLRWPGTFPGDALGHWHAELVILLSAEQAARASVS